MSDEINAPGVNMRDAAEAHLRAMGLGDEDTIRQLAMLTGGIPDWAKTELELVLPRETIDQIDAEARSAKEARDGATEEN